MLIFSKIILTLFVFSSVASSAEQVDPNDVKLSQKKFLISGAFYDDLYKGDKGALTLCFKENKESYDHVSLVFEYFSDKNPENISLRMIHFQRSDVNCLGCGGKQAIIIDGSDDTIKKAYRAIRLSCDDVKGQPVPAAYVKYASWILPNKSLLKGIREAERDKVRVSKGGKPGDSISFCSCVKYVSKIMRTVGLKNIDFWWWWPTTPESLKILVRDHCEPKPTILFLETK